MGAKPRPGWVGVSLGWRVSRGMGRDARAVFILLGVCSAISTQGKLRRLLQGTLPAPACTSVSLLPPPPALGVSQGLPLSC